MDVSWKYVTNKSKGSVSLLALGILLDCIYLFRGTLSLQLHNLLSCKYVYIHNIDKYYIHIYIYVNIKACASL